MQPLLDELAGTAHLSNSPIEFDVLLRELFAEGSSSHRPEALGLSDRVGCVSELGFEAAPPQAFLSEC